MPRPRKADGVPPMKEKIEEAFWGFYEQKPLEKISVREICQAAGCNKTTFYYHFHDLREVLDTIEERCLPLEAPDIMSELLTASDKAALAAEFIDRMGERFERYCTLLSSRGDPDFAKKARTIMTQRWCEKTGVNYDSLSAEDQMAIRLAMGGSISIFADHGDGEPLDPEAFIVAALTMIMPLAEKLLGESSQAA